MGSECFQSSLRPVISKFLKSFSSQTVTSLQTYRNPPAQSLPYQLLDLLRLLHIPGPVLSLQQKASGGGSHAGTITGGIVGTLAALGIIGALVIWFVMKSKRSKVAPSSAFISNYKLPDTYPKFGQPPPSPGPFSPPQTKYDAFNTSVFPPASMILRSVQLLVTPKLRTIPTLREGVSTVALLKFELGTLGLRCDLPIRSPLLLFVHTCCSISLVRF